MSILCAQIRKIKTKLQARGPKVKSPFPSLKVRPAHGYLNFNVLRAKSAKTRAAIQNRAMIFDSFHPSSSK